MAKSDTHEITEGQCIPEGFSHAFQGDAEYLFFRNERLVMEFKFPRGTNIECELRELDPFDNPFFSFGASADPEAAI